MYKKIYRNATFLISAESLEQLPADIGYEVAFIGSSNVGKSSAINAITNISGLAQSSKMPGRTQTINLFALDETHRLVDLPGYGYAKVPRQLQRRFQALSDLYLKTRKCLTGLILLMDIRHPLKTLDQRMVEWTLACQVPFHVLLTKADKLSHSACINALKETKKALHAYDPSISVQTFSSHEHVGLSEVHKVLYQWLFTTTKTEASKKVES